MLNYYEGRFSKERREIKEFNNRELAISFILTVMMILVFIVPNLK